MDYDQNPIIVYTAYSFEEMRAFQKWHFKRQRTPVWVLLIMALLAQAFMFVNMILDRIVFSSVVHSQLLILLFVLLLVLFICLYSGTFYTRKAHARAAKLMQSGQRVMFRSCDFTVVSEQPLFAGQSFVAYPLLEKVVETPEMFYLYINKNQAYLVSKQGFETASPGELSYFLQSVIPPEKYNLVK